MAFPILPWFQRQMTVERIDQHFARHSYRMILGLEVVPDFSQIRAALLLTAGRGKYLRATHSIADQSDVPQTLANELRSLCRDNSNSTKPPSDGVALYYDLAEHQANLVQRLKAQAGKYVERILAISVMDPGIWTTDFDGRMFYRSACDAVRLAELTGMNVIDGYPQADLYAGGTTCPLAGLPLWLQFADRSTPCAEVTTLVADLTHDLECWGLPGSDGADDWLPSISWRRFAGDSSSVDPPTNNIPTDREVDTEVGQIVGFARDLQKRVEPNLPIGQVIFLGTNQRADRVLDLLRHRWPSDWEPAMMLRVAPDAEPRKTNPELESGPSVVQATMPGLPSPGLREPGQAAVGFSGLISGLLGMLHIDQIPANLPHLTGASGMRVLGRLTPGRLSAWRHLLVNMTDTQSPVMRLKDAI